MPVFDKIAIVGVGLIGGSAGIAALERGIASEVWGVARRRETIDSALSAGAVSRGTLSLAEGVEGADFVLVASPTAAVPGIVRECLPLLRPGAVVTDAASVKRDIVCEVEGFIGEKAIFIGSHPAAGSEKSGVEFADGNLFEGADCVITPLPGRGAGVSEAAKFWEMLGMRVYSMSPEAHDSLMALTSHLPHIASCGLVNAVGELFRRESGGPFIAGGGFRDTTRIAAAPAALWKDIVLSNRDNLAAGLREYAGILKSLERALLENDADYVLEFLSRAGENREKLMKRRGAVE